MRFSPGILATGPRDGALYAYQPAEREIMTKARSIANICDRHGVPQSLHYNFIASSAVRPSYQAQYPNNRAISRLCGTHSDDLGKMKEAPPPRTY